MRLLIVEDEYYTRQGIIDGIDLAAIGFDEVDQADDGVNALRRARTFPPDVVLADVRMPRMDGVELCYSLRRLYPDCSIVFMSGYADREYLKAAIDLKAASYVEKPFRTRELRVVLENAAAQRRQEKERERREAALLVRAEAGIPLLRSEAALMLVQHDPEDPRVRRALENCGLSLSSTAALVVAVLRPSGLAFPEEPAFRERLLAIIDAEATRASVENLVAFRGAEAVVIILMVAAERARALGDRETSRFLERVVTGAGAGAMVAGASAVMNGLASARAAHEAAVSALGAAFFRGPGTVALDAACGREDLRVEPDAEDTFQSCLDREEAVEAFTELRGRVEAMQSSGSRDSPRAREYLTRVALRLVAYAERRGVDPFGPGGSVRLLTESVERAGTLGAAAAMIEAPLALAFEKLAALVADGRVVAEIKRAVHRGYGLPGLSIDDIARDAGVSPAYACRLFKESTGETIHRYVTAYRLERAKDLLRDARQPKMAEVASRSGFADPNYFARAFRRATGVSPSEFRESR